MRHGALIGRNNMAESEIIRMRDVCPILWRAVKLPCYGLLVKIHGIDNKWLPILIPTSLLSIRNNNKGSIIVSIGPVPNLLRFLQGGIVSEYHRDSRLVACN